MINTKILLSVVIVLLIGVAAAGYQINNNKNISSLWQPSAATTGTTTQSQDTQSQGTSGLSSSSGQGHTTGTEVYSSGTSQTGGSNVISSSAAKTAAQNVIDVAGAKAGTPKLSSDGTYYTVPVMQNGEAIGEIEVNATTGKVMGGSA